MKFSFTLEEILEMPEEVRAYLESYISSKIKNKNIGSIIREDKVYEHGNVKLIQMTNAHVLEQRLLDINMSKNGNACSVKNCKALASEVDVYFRTPLSAGGDFNIHNMDLFCRKHRYKSPPKLIENISVEAAANLILGLNIQGMNILKAIVNGEYEEKVSIKKILKSEKYNLDFKNTSSLNGALSGINRRFNNLVNKSYRVNIYSTKGLSDKNSYIKIGKCVHYSIKSALKNWELLDKIRVTQTYIPNKGIIKHSEKYGYYLALPDMGNNITENFDFGNEIKTITTEQSLN